MTSDFGNGPAGIRTLITGIKTQGLASKRPGYITRRRFELRFPA